MTFMHTVGLHDIKTCKIITLSIKSIQNEYQMHHSVVYHNYWKSMGSSFYHINFCFMPDPNIF